MKTDNPEVQRFQVSAANDQDHVEVFLGPLTGLIKTAKWPIVDGEVVGTGVAQTIVMPRAALIGLCYEILSAVDRGE